MDKTDTFETSTGTVVLSGEPFLNRIQRFISLPSHSGRPHHHPHHLVGLSFHFTLLANASTSLATVFVALETTLATVAFTDVY